MVSHCIPVFETRILELVVRNTTMQPDPSQIRNGDWGIPKSEVSLNRIAPRWLGDLLTKAISSKSRIIILTINWRFPQFRIRVCAKWIEVSPICDVRRTFIRPIEPRHAGIRISTNSGVNKWLHDTYFFD
jgi:hypothetical protein